MMFIHLQKGHGVAFGDFGNDGDQDIFHVLGGAYEGDVFRDVFFENKSHNENNWITILTEGTDANRSAIGATIRLTCSVGAGKQRFIYRSVSTGGSFGASSLQQEIGIGKATKIDEITIQWPNAKKSFSIFKDIKPKQFVFIKEGVDTIQYLPRKTFPFQ